MAKIQNQAIMQKLIDELELYPAKDVIPTELAEKILPVFQVNSEEIKLNTPTANVVRSAQESAGGSTTIYTTPATGKFYLTNVQLQAMCHTTNGSDSCYIQITIDGTTQKIAWMQFYQPSTQLNYFSDVVCLNLQNPILIDAGTNIVLTSADSALDCSAVIVGYTED